MKRTLRCALSALVIGAAALAGSGAPAFAWPDGLPTYEQYPLRDRIFGSGGAFFPNYSMPSEDGIAYVIASGGALNGGVVKGTARAGLPIFATGTVDFNCQPSQRPQVRVLSAPAGGKVVVSPGRFVAAGTDAGSTKCLGQPVSGQVVRYVGPTRGGAVTLRVTYPTMGAWYDHVVQVPGRQGR
ncbi:hypothetical protein ACLBXM_04360 [Xanthobacteraceae bacterium A53D]